MASQTISGRLKIILLIFYSFILFMLQNLVPVNKKSFCHGVSRTGQILLVDVFHQGNQPWRHFLYKIFILFYFFLTLSANSMAYTRMSALLSWMLLCIALSVVDSDFNCREKSLYYTVVHKERICTFVLSNTFICVAVCFIHCKLKIILWYFM